MAFAGGENARPGRRAEPQPAPRSRRRRGRDYPVVFLRLASRKGSGLVMAAALFGSVFAYGTAIGGGYDAFVERNGSIPNVAARLVGFGLDVITITGQRELRYMEILAASGVSGRDSLPFLDAREVREQVMKMPLVREASVRKLYPDRLVIEVVEREAHALWQKDGEVFVISADGVPIDNLRDDRFVHLPFVVGDGANKRVHEFQKILEAAGELRSRIRAGVLVTNRRWNVQLVTGVDVKLPEIGAERAIAALAQLSRDERILDKDLISIDMRIPGRLVARLTEGASAVHEANRKPRRRGA